MELAEVPLELLKLGKAECPLGQSVSMGTTIQDSGRRERSDDILICS